MKKIFFLAATAFVLSMTAGCPEMPEDKPVTKLPTPPAPVVNNDGVGEDGSVPVEEVDPKQFAKEQAAADELEKLGALVIREGSEKVVTSVNFLGNGKNIDRKTAELLASLFRTGTLNLANTDMGDEQLKVLRNNRRVVNLLLNGTHITDESLQYLSEMSRLTSLYLIGTNVTDAGLPQLAKLPALAILDVSDTKVTDRGLPEIAKSQSVNWLLLGGENITDEGLKSLAVMPNLGRLTLLDTKVTEQGVNALKNAIPKLQKVDLGSRKPLENK